jgi:predicted RecA/RadA family phage recombinase
MSKAIPKSSPEGWRSLQDAPAGDVAVGDVTVINGLVTFAYADIAATENGQFVYKADDVLVTKVSGTAANTGDPAYYDSGADEFTPTVGAGPNTLCGTFIADAASGDTEAYINLDATLAHNQA